jgi:hypothetical protein
VLSLKRAAIADANSGGAWRTTVPEATASGAAIRAAAATVTGPDGRCRHAAVDEQSSLGKNDCQPCEHSARSRLIRAGLRA